MARIRTLKPEFWQDEKLSRCPPMSRLVFLGLISQADDEGRLIDNPKLIDGLLFPNTADSCAESLTLLASLGRILRYTSGSGQRLIQVAGWPRHQKVKNPSKYNLPAPSDIDCAKLPKQSAVNEALAEIGGESTESLRRTAVNPNAPIPDPRSPIPDLTDTKATPLADADVDKSGIVEGETPHAYLMPILRKHGYEADGHDGSILKALLKKRTKIPDIEAAVIGLSYLRDGGKLEFMGVQKGQKLSLRMLYALQGNATRPLWREAEEEYYRLQPKQPRPHGMKPLADVLKRVVNE